MSDQALANQGIMPGSEAYNQAKQQLAQQQNDLLTQASLGGAQVQNQMYNQALANANLGNQANQIGFGQQLSTYGTNLASPLTYAQQVKSLATPNYVNPPAAGAPPPNILVKPLNVPVGAIKAIPPRPIKPPSICELRACSAL